MDVDDRSDPELRDEDRAAVLAHARRWFPELVPDDGAFADLPLLDRTTAEQWYTREVRGARTFTSSGTSGHPKRIPWTAAEDDWYVGEKQHLFADRLADCRRRFISLAAGHNAGSAHRVLEHLGMTVHDAGLSDLGDQREMVVAFRPDVLYCSPTMVGSPGSAALVRDV